MNSQHLEEPHISPLVKALTRAPTLMGVPYMYFMFNGVVSSVCFLISHNLFLLLVAIPLHLFGYILTLRDDRIFEILFVKSTRCPPRSRAFWAADSYRA
ncbi:MULTISPECIES: VirB3 family type IV secretion system protein [Xanthobacteraceae]|jgi:type IV secretion system protein VirB3|uniref:Type IV secretory pathway, VirB3 n=1 Tax=Ancylobacter dichloromethanicus TaxID=518825 RepID=A0A9W6J3X9_9HYPH|nr:VirB3 family type IV secretion system protein [Ancylobacter dichloromethanicus]OYW34957.1 MAG: conjugal transfer protein [Rhizobiales bacterium 12-66-7]OYX75262.1 MAG: conjugal transfer protein [Rhizobiales bacterium 32-66-11]OYY89066.1 MAG: conjugal transfer protein [Rhizobiales bacterium 35-66-30]OYZ78055.1 MAG: conjugal transfer protein [Rhizobiales bacterium 24-66-13]OZB11478.1 MAG: conjugal transfer protein [Rhizobiales bacterium 39-66-18]